MATILQLHLLQYSATQTLYYGWHTTKDQATGYSPPMHLYACYRPGLVERALCLPPALSTRACLLPGVMDCPVGQVLLAKVGTAKH